MRSLVFLVLCGVLAVSIEHATCITNGEFYEFVSAYGREVDHDDDSADAIVILGDPDDELDIGNLVKKLGLDSPVQGGNKGKKTSLWWHHHHHHHHHSPEFKCSCSKDHCKCCVHHKFKFWIKSFNLKACMALQYEPSDHKFILDFTVMGRSVYKKEVSLEKFTKLCYPVPGLGNLAKVCLEIYDIKLAQLHACARLTGEIDLKVHKFAVHLKLGCINIPTSEQLGYLRPASMQDRLSVEVLPTDISDRFRKLADETLRDEDEEDEAQRFEY